MQYQNRRRRKLLKVIEKENEDLRFEHESLEILRQCRPLTEAITFFMVRGGLDMDEMSALRECLTILARGRLTKKKK